MNKHHERCPSDITLLQVQHPGSKEEEREGRRIERKSNYMVPLNVALTFRSGQRSKWHADRFTEGLQRG